REGRLAVNAEPAVKTNMKIHVRAVMSLVALFAMSGSARAQSLSYNSGQPVAPAYEGWEEGSDGAKYFLFGYMNRNWEEEIDMAVGPNNSFGPGAADVGQ